MAKKRSFEWVTIAYEGENYDVCVGTVVEEIDEVRPVDSEINIYAVMRIDVIEWMLEKALDEIHTQKNSPRFCDMSRREREIDEKSIYPDWGVSK